MTTIFRTKQFIELHGKMNDGIGDTYVENPTVSVRIVAFTDPEDVSRLLSAALRAYEEKLVGSTASVHRVIGVGEPA